jgi:D-glucosaminate-6-phosphate ammonia-lyase
MSWLETLNGVTRRDLFKGGGWLAALGLAPRLPAAAAAAPTLSLGTDIYQSINVRPLVNCKGTFTIITGSQSLPEVKKAMEAASHHYVQLDELMEGVGKRLAEITQAPFGIVTAGCAAAMTHATSACIAGADPERMQRLPNLHGMKNEVVIPRNSRNVYDHAIRMLGVRMVEVETKEQYLAALGDKTAMVYILAGPGDEFLPQVAEATRQKGIPIFVDAAAEELTIPNHHLQRGATMVGYSGGKCLRGPQCAGLLLGPRDLLWAAWLNSAPHHAFGRSLKVGKEEIMGMLAAVEMWPKRDHQAEWKTWEGWIDTIAQSVKRVPTVKTEVIQPRDLSNHAPQLRISWDAAKVGVTGDLVEQTALEGNPRIVLGGSTGGRRRPDQESSITIMPYMMTPGDDKIAAARFYEILSHPPAAPRRAPAGTPAQVAGQWDVRLEFVRGAANHRLFLEQTGDTVTGTHRNETLTTDLRGGVEGDQVLLRSSFRYEGTRLNYEFEGRLANNRLTGTVNLGEYGTARFTAERHQYAGPQRGA